MTRAIDPRLPPDSAPWGRQVNDRLGNVEYETTKIREDVSNTLRGVNGALTQLSKQVFALNELTAQLAAQQATLNAQQAALASQQATLSSQQASLSAAVNDIASLASNQVFGATASNTTGGAIAVSTGVTYAPAVVTVPAGFTRAYVIGVSNLVPSGNSPLLVAQTNISGDLGFATPVYAGGAGDVIACGSTSHATFFSGLSAGVGISVGARIVSQNAVNNVYIINSMSVTFLK